MVPMHMGRVVGACCFCTCCLFSIADYYPVWRTYSRCTICNIFYSVHCYSCECAYLDLCEKRREGAVAVGKVRYNGFMSTSQSTIDYLIDQMQGAGRLRSRKMFGEYAVYCDDKVVALICDDQLFVKPTKGGAAFIGDITEAPPYPGSKPFFRIDEEKWEDREWLRSLILTTTQEVPAKKLRR